MKNVVFPSYTVHHREDRAVSNRQTKIPGVTWRTVTWVNSEIVFVHLVQRFPFWLVLGVLLFVDTYCTMVAADIRSGL